MVWWTYLLMAWPPGAFVYTLAREGEASGFFVRSVPVPALVLTGVTMWQRGRARRLIPGARQPQLYRAEDGLG